ncbi:TonB-dependent receptor [Flavobacterium agrisoli]|uniref:TonB-dependent receptor n=1 Tax=Flavobacterium agrisoli TaxID=2793066 RepID=A0A934PP22_9FLAO|nr:TonB-dependent receptor plug domain-containing protein [Flavobacterium agrisoli]MBK0370809.1 TonB-dependent receptor [Flavobacterium agrisoli]
MKGKNYHFFYQALVLIFALFCTNFIVAQSGNVSGKILLGNSQPLPGANILIKGNTIQRSAISGNNGDYFIENLPYGHYDMEISSLESETKKHHIHHNSPKHVSNIKVEKASTKELEHVIVQTTSKKKKIETTGFAVTVIETKEASLRNLTTNELLDRSVGVRVRQNGGIGSNVEYNLNGMSGSTIGVFLDGIEVSTYGSSFNLNNIPPSMIERIEVYKGVLPSHLTGDYVGGAINVVLKKDVSQNNFTAAASYGSFNTFQSDLGGSYRDKKTGLAVRGSGFYTYTDNSYETWGRSTKYVNRDLQQIPYYRAKRFNNTYKNIGGRIEAGFTDTKWADQFFIGYNGSSNYTELPHGITMATPYMGRFSETKAHVLLLNYIKRDFLIKNLALNINGTRSFRSTYVQDTVGYAYNWDGKIRETPTEEYLLDESGNQVPKRDSLGNIIYRKDDQTVPEYETETVYIPLKTLLGGQQGRKTITNTDRKITNVRSNLGYLVANGHRVSLNHKYEATDRKDEDLFNQNMTGLATVSKISKHILSMNYEAETFNKKLRTNILGKYTNNRTSQTSYEIATTDNVNTLIRKDTVTTDYNFGYGATVSYNILSNLYLIGSTENSPIMPSDEQIFGDPELNILSNLDLQPEKYINYNLGFRWGPADFGKHRISLYGNLFWRNGYNKIVRQTVADSDIEDEAEADIQVTKYVNLDQTQAKGFEAEVNYVYNNRLNASFNISKFNNLDKSEIDDQGNPNAYYGHQVANEPYFTMNLNTQYSFRNVFQKESVLYAYYNFGYVGEYYVVRGEPSWSKTPAQIPQDLGFSYRFPSKKLIASLDIKNIFNAEVYDNFQIQKPGRGIYFKLNYTFNTFL